jgi:hypothetical protein
VPSLECWPQKGDCKDCPIWSVGPRGGGGTLRIAQERGERAKKKAQMQPQRGVDFTNNTTMFQKHMSKDFTNEQGR